MKNKLISFIILAITVTTVSFVACRKHDLATESGPGDRSAVSTEGTPSYELAFTITYSNETVLTLSQSSLNANIYKANYDGIDYDVTYDPASGHITAYNGEELIFEHTGIMDGGWPGDCSKTGGRKENETYADCYERNFDNFCCDFTSCAAFAMFPVPVLTAIGVACTMTGSVLDVNAILNNRSQEIVYTNPNNN